MALRIFALAIADLAAFCWLVQLEAFGAFAGHFQLELTKQQGFGAVLSCELPGHQAVAVGYRYSRLPLVLLGWLNQDGAQFVLRMSLVGVLLGQVLVAMGLEANGEFDDVARHADHLCVAGSVFCGHVDALKIEGHVP